MDKLSVVMFVLENEFLVSIRRPSKGFGMHCCGSLSEHCWNVCICHIVLKDLLELLEFMICVSCVCSLHVWAFTKSLFVVVVVSLVFSIVRAH